MIGLVVSCWEGLGFDITSSMEIRVHIRLLIMWLLFSPVIITHFTSALWSSWHHDVQKKQNGWGRWDRRSHLTDLLIFMLGTRKRQNGEREREIESF